MIWSLFQNFELQKNKIDISLIDMQIIDFDFADPCIWVSIFSSCGPFLVPFLKNCGPFLVPFLKNCGPFLVPFRDSFFQGPKLSPLPLEETTYDLPLE